MKRYILLIPFLILSFAIQSCKNQTNKETPETEIQLKGLTLNNNEKWVANEETHMGMQRIDSILKNNTSKSGKTLGNVLSKETSYIIKSCDMKGKAHDQLHIVLVPILEEITEIKDIDNNKEIERKINYLNRLVSTYFKFFKT